MKYFSGSLDTNALLRLFLRDVSHQHEAVKHLLEEGEGLFAVADAAVIEMVFVLERYYGLTRLEIRDLVELFMAMPNINCNRVLFKNALPFFEKHPALSFEDCCLATYAELNNAQPLWTFDKKLSTQSKNAELITAR